MSLVLCRWCRVCGSDALMAVANRDPAPAAGVFGGAGNAKLGKARRPIEPTAVINLGSLEAHQATSRHHIICSLNMVCRGKVPQHPRLMYCVNSSMM